MNPIKYSLKRLMKEGIPRPILNVTFLSRYANQNAINIFTLETKIHEEIILDRVIEDMNLTYGTMMTIPLGSCQRLQGDYYSSVWQVPKSLTQGKSIISVSELTAAMGTITTMDGGISGGVTGGGTMPSLSTQSMLSGYSSVGAVAGAFQQVVNSVSPIPNISNALCYLVGDNTVMIKDATLNPSTMFLRVFVENDSNLNHLLPEYYMMFYELVLLATQAYIYNNIVLDQDNAFIASGGELNRFKEIVDGYSDASETYKEKIEEWSQAGLLNDPESKRQHYQFTAGGGW